MAFKPYCRECSSWHRPDEAHIQKGSHFVASKQQKINWITPLGRGRWLSLITPRSFKNATTGQDGAPKYEGNLVFDGDALAEAEDFLNKTAKELFPRAKHVKLPLQQDSKDENVYFLKAKSGKDYRPVLIDAKNKKIPDGTVEVGNGSILRFAVTLVPYETMGNPGITAYLNKVQVVKLVTRDSSPFTALEGGFEFEGSDEQDAQEFSPLPDAEIEAEIGAAVRVARRSREGMHDF